MAAPKDRSRSKRKVYRRVLSGKVKRVYLKRKPSKAVCGACGKVLPGVLRERPYRMKTLAKSKKRPERPYGGVLCSRCSRKTIVERFTNFFGGEDK